MVVRFRNDLPEETTIHWHGLHLPFVADGSPFHPVTPGQEFEYAFTIPAGTAGTYLYHPAAGELERLGDVDTRTKTHLALDQRWAGDAHANVYLLTDVDAVVERLGNRGYRLAQLEAGLTLGRLYLAAYAHRSLGGTGLTFYDDEVTEHLSPRGAGQTPTCLFAFGKREG